MIPTQYKSKLPRHLSYPIGAESLTEGLLDSPHVDVFHLSFYGSGGRTHSEFHQTLTQNEPYAILVAEFQPARKPGYSGAQFMIDRGYYEEKWQLTVYPVTRELRHVTNLLLREQGLPSVVEWLRASDRVEWRSRKQRIELTLNPADQTLSSHVSSGV